MALVEHHARTIHLRLHAERQKSSSSQDVQPAAQEWQALGEEINMLAEQWSISNMFYTAAAQGKVPDMHSSMEVDADSLDIESSGSSVVPPLFTDNGQPLASADEPNLFEVDLATTEKEEDTAARRVIPTTRAERLELLQQRRAADAARKLERATSTQMMSELKYAIAGRLPASVEAAH